MVVVNINKMSFLKVLGPYFVVNVETRHGWLAVLFIVQQPLLIGEVDARVNRTFHSIQS